MEIISEQINSMINTQIGRELHNANQYLAISAYFKDKALNNISNEYAKEAQGEREHAQRFIDFLVDFRGKINIPTINEPINEFNSAIDAVRSALSLELKTTEYIYEILEIANQSKNWILYNFMLWFVNEQQEEIATANDRLSIISRNRDGLEIADMAFEEKA